MQHTHQNRDRKSSEHYSHRGGTPTDKAPSERQQDQLSGDGWPSAPPPGQEYSSGDKQEQEAETSHQGRDSNSYNRPGRPDLSDLKRCVRQSEKCFECQ